MHKPPSKINPKIRLSRQAGREDAINAIKNYHTECNEAMPHEILRVVLMEVVFRTGAIYGSLTTKRKRIKIDICTHTTEEQKLILENVIIDKKPLKVWLQELPAHSCDNASVQVSTKVKGIALHRKRDNFYTELKSISSVVSIDIFGNCATPCRLTLLLSGDPKKECSLVRDSLIKFRNSINILHPWNWLNKASKSLRLPGRSVVGTPSSISYRMLGLPDHSISSLLENLDGEFSPKRHEYKVYLLWPEEYSSKSSGRLRHWPTETQLQGLKKKLNAKQLTQFLDLSWQQGSAICNYVVETGLPYYSSNWREDTKQDYLKVEEKVMYANDIFQIPIIHRNQLLAILAVNANSLSFSERLTIYEKVTQKTMIILKAAERDLERSHVIRNAVEKQLDGISHDMRIDLIEYMYTSLKEMTTCDEASETLIIDTSELSKLRRISNYLLTVFLLHKTGKAGFAILSDEIKKYINTYTVKKIELGKFIEEIDHLVKAANKLEPPCSFDNCNNELYVECIPDWLAIAFFNLIHNARKHFNNRINVASDSVIQISGITNDKSIIISISDSSGGIPSEIQHRIFDYKFSHGKKRGNGIGLWLVKEIIEAHNGTIIPVFYRNGTRFDIQLPVKLSRKEN